MDYRNAKIENLSRGIRNNNPFNIEVSSKNYWQGLASSSTDGRFCQFIDIDFGLRAGIVLLRNYINIHGLYSITGIIDRFAPASENGISSYRHYCEYVKLVVGDDLVDFDERFFRLCKSILWYESNYRLTFLEFMRICFKYKILDGLFVKNNTIKFDKI